MLQVHLFWPAALEVARDLVIRHEKEHEWVSKRSVVSRSSERILNSHARLTFKTCIASTTSSSLTQGNSSTPESIKKHLKPFTPAERRGGSSACTTFRDGTSNILEATYQISRNNSSPKSYVDRALALCCL